MIKASDTIEELIERYPGIDKYLRKWDIVCVLCGEPVWARLGDLISQKSLNEDKIISELNQRFTSQ
jgi:hypothetical protein